MEFTYKTYDRLLKLLKNQGFTSEKFTNYSSKNKLYLRHDVDILVEGVLKMAEIEINNGMNSIWFFQPNCEFYNMLSSSTLKIIKTLQEMGHWVGLHIDASIANNLKSLIGIVNDTYRFYSKFMELEPIISFHKPPKYVREDFQIEGFINVYGKKYFKDIRYFSDSARKEFEEFLIESLKEDNTTSIQLLTHPVWWNYENMDLTQTWLRLLESKKRTFLFAIREFKPYKNFKEEL